MPFCSALHGAIIFLLVEKYSSELYPLLCMSDVTSTLLKLHDLSGPSLRKEEIVWSLCLAGGFAQFSLNVQVRAVVVRC